MCIFFITVAFFLPAALHVVDKTDQNDLISRPICLNYCIVVFVWQWAVELVTKVKALGSFQTAERLSVVSQDTQSLGIIQCIAAFCRMSHLIYNCTLYTCHVALPLISLSTMRPSKSKHFHLHVESIRSHYF